MRITTMLDALVRVEAMQGNIANKHRRQRQYHAFRDGIHRRFIRLEMERDQWKAKFLNEEAVNNLLEGEMSLYDIADFVAGGE